MKKIFALAPVALLVCSTVAQAHGPTRQKMSESIVIKAAPAAVWDKIKDFGNTAWLPMIASNKAEGGNADGAKRTLTLKNGGTIKEEMVKYEADKMSYKYKIDSVEPITAMPVNNYAATITVTAADGGAKVEWNGAYYRAYMNNCPCPPGQDEEAANKAVSDLYKAGLASLKASVEK